MPRKPSATSTTIAWVILTRPGPPTRRRWSPSRGGSARLAKGLVRACEEFERWDKPPKFTERWQSCPSRSGLPPWRLRAVSAARPAASAEAEAELQRLQAEHPQDTQVLFQLSLVSAGSGRARWRRLSCIAGSRTVQSDRADAEEAIGNIYRDHARDFDKAQLPTRRRWPPSRGGSARRRGLVRACEEFERWDQAAEVYRKVAELSEPERVAALACAAWCLGKAGRVAEAEAEFQRLQAERPQERGFFSN